MDEATPLDTPSETQAGYGDATNLFQVIDREKYAVLESHDLVPDHISPPPGLLIPLLNDSSSFSTINAFSSTIR
jgi:hypothetical protein